MPPELVEEYRKLIGAIERKAKDRIAGGYEEQIRGCHKPDPDDPEPEIPTIASFTEHIQSNAKSEKGVVSTDFIRRATLHDLEQADWFWSAVLGWRNAKFHTVGHRCLKSVQQALRERFPNEDFGNRLKSYSSEDWSKKLRLKRSVVLRRKGPSKDNPASQDALDAGNDYYYFVHPYCKIWKRIARRFSRDEEYQKLRAWLLDGEIPPSVREKVNRPARNRIIHKPARLQTANAETKLDAFFQFLRKRNRPSRKFLGIFLNQLFSPADQPGSRAKQLAPSRMAELLASELAEIAVNELQKHLQTQRKSPLGHVSF
jgi:hypothetical protein